MKVCPLCNSEKADDCFYSGANQCKECRKNKVRQYSSNPEIKEKIKEQRKQYRSNPEIKEKRKKYISKYYSNPEVKEKLKEQQKQYRKEYLIKNKEKFSCQRNRRQSQRRKRDAGFKVRMLVSTSILCALKNNGGSKQGASCFECLSYTKEELKQHLENLFEPWMNWDNHGKYNVLTHDENPTWNIDHIIPHSTFKYDSLEHPDFAKCWALSNLRPLCAKQNIEDGNRREKV